MFFTPHHFEVRRLKSLQSLKRSVAQNTLKTATLCVGGGISCRGLNEGLKTAGMRSSTQFVVDIDGSFLDVAEEKVHGIDDNCLVFEGSINEIEYDLLPTSLDVLNLSLPCVGFSVAGKAKNAIKAAELHQKGGTVFIGALNIIEHCRPALITAENVKGWSGSLSEALVNAWLQELGYTIQDIVLDGEFAGTLETRQRHYWVAALNGIEFDINALPANDPQYATLGAAMENVGPDSELWKDLAYLREKSVRDAANGKGFQPQPVNAESTKVPTIGAGYWKYRSSEPRIPHQTDPKLERNLTGVEHARVKGIPEDHAEGLTQTLAHTVFGNSVLYPVFVSFGRFIAEVVRNWSSNHAAQLQFAA